MTIELIENQENLLEMRAEVVKKYYKSNQTDNK